MAVNSYKADEKSVEKSKAQTLKRLFSYLLAYKWQIILVLLIMGYGVAVSLVNPLIMESAIDDYIAVKNLKGLYKLLIIALAINLLLVLTVKLRMYIMAKVCNQILLTIRQELYTHIQKLDFHFFDSRPTGKILSRIIGDINSLKDVLSNCVTTLIPDGLTVIAVVVIMVYKNPKLAAASLLTVPFMAGAMFFIAFSSEQDKLIHREYGMEVDYLFENQEYYQEYIGSPFVISGPQIEFEMPDNNLKAYYYRLVEQKNLKKLMQELIQKKRIEFVENYQKIVQTRIYSIASIENMAYDLDRKLEDKNSLKKERKK